ncbi:hypothetical protein [Bradyrhizobium sp. F1.13.3]|uniref:hypothetical protein n=1 Tax=Bradyrhizobium sp. F1.13.3 TaxID=3156351 RepID=UPI0033952D66
MTLGRRRIARLSRWFVWPHRLVKSDLENPHRPCDVLQLPFAFILKNDVELAPNLSLRIIGRR